jgi:Trk K+ transport system NAD-binding subunit
MATKPKRPIHPDALNDAYKNNFDTLVKAISNGDVALLSCRDAKTNEFRAVVCAVMTDGTDKVFVPLAKLFDGNPYEELSPPV